MTHGLAGALLVAHALGTGDALADAVLRHPGLVVLPLVSSGLVSPREETVPTVKGSAA